MPDGNLYELYEKLLYRIERLEIAVARIEEKLNINKYVLYLTSAVAGGLVAMVVNIAFK